MRWLSPQFPNVMPIAFKHHSRKLEKLWSWSLGLGVLLGAVVSSPALGADSLTVSLAGITITATTQDLTGFSQTGELPANLAPLGTFLSAGDLAALRSALQQKITFPTEGTSQLLNTPAGQRVLNVLGQFIQTSNRQSGASGLKTALIQAAQAPQGLTLLGVIENFPDATINIDAAQAIPLVNAIFSEISTTKAVINIVNQQSQTALAKSPNLPSTLVDLTAPGPNTWQVQSLTLNNKTANFQFPVTLYVPNISGTIPLVVISPGLGEDLNTFAYLAEHLASYGFGVAILDHPGSDATRQTEFLAGKIPEEILPQEFINRPQSISVTLDYLAQLSKVKFNTQTVGLLGHSFGGYDTWALAGATQDSTTLTAACQNPETIIKPSVILDCKVTRLPGPLPNFRDSRIQAAMAINPIGGTIYGSTGFQAIQIPMLVLAGSEDFIAPPLVEQFQPFSRLSSAPKYLVLLNGGTHMSTMGDLPPENSPNALPPFVVGSDPGIARNQLQAVTVAFMQAYINGQSNFQAYLSPAYLAKLSQPQMKATLTQSLTPDQIEAAASPPK
ncbi:alpha/beta hydrolase [Synechococcus sp. PCC 6312]|uniref:alpha/beta hydrolase n=1 Tax=Synechococcus sp. (strain ATCC 27167 / PCC 6312) TaxID=195253 RepID=UPI00029F2BF0|nr:alpha/beta hydrolase [Synechococcus sp. PCC 6312]AFY62362.1 putative dienelactone hydrolase [Synechococcus sp. PCC 6312]